MRKHKKGQDIKVFEKGQNIGYGEYGCCRCRKPLEGLYNFVGDVKDEEGHDWSGFCDDCWNLVSHNSAEFLASLYHQSECLIGTDTPVKCKAVVLTIKLYGMDDDGKRQPSPESEIQEIFKELQELDDVQGYSIHGCELIETEM